jgi:hypothetical protein
MPRATAETVNAYATKHSEPADRRGGILSKREQGGAKQVEEPMMTNRTMWLTGVAAILPIALFSGSASAQGTAQNAPPQAAGPAYADQTIVVTARRRSEDIQKVPAAITAFGAAQL